MTEQILFYPQHFKKTRPYAKEYLAGLDALVTAGTLSPKTGHDLSAREIIRGYDQAGIKVAGPQFNTQGFTIETQAALIYGEWVQRGAALYAFKQPLTEALMASSVDEVTLSDLNFPFNCIYFHFGAQPELVLQSGAAVTGAYVLWHPGQALRVSLTAPLPPETAWTDRWPEIYDLRILAKHFDTDIESAIAQALTDDAEDIRAATATLASQTSSLARASVVAAAAFLETHAANRATLTRCMQLIANALCYVTAYPSDTQTKWQTGTPSKLRTQSEFGLPKEAGRAVSKLHALGYRMVQYIGGEFSDASANTDGGQMTPHMRRGHWKMQPYGPKLSLRKLQWRRRTRVLGGGVTPDEPRVYDTDKRS